MRERIGYSSAAASGPSPPNVDTPQALKLNPAERRCGPFVSTCMDCPVCVRRAAWITYCVTAECARYVELAHGFHNDHQLAVAVADVVVLLQHAQEAEHFSRRLQQHLALRIGKHLQCTR